ncbi:MAG: hypothetical protein ACRDKA_14785 [Actinomycetota bacterium]
MSRQAALLLALAAVAAAGALISFGSWILLRRGRTSGDHERGHPETNDEAGT